ncbi:hypothetical protein DFH09DRAFT_1092499 [Mycena vulgaris]|nr:hypothetical protein DFH09DRAFT_1092499 [Mycena vulgaris]
MKDARGDGACQMRRTRAVGVRMLGEERWSGSGREDGELRWVNVQPRIEGLVTGRRADRKTETYRKHSLNALAVPPPAGRGTNRGRRVGPRDVERRHECGPVPRMANLILPTQFGHLGDAVEAANERWGKKPPSERKMVRASARSIAPWNKRRMVTPFDSGSSHVLSGLYFFLLRARPLSPHPANDHRLDGSQIIKLSGRDMETHQHRTLNVLYKSGSSTEFARFDSGAAPPFDSGSSHVLGASTFFALRSTSFSPHPAGNHHCDLGAQEIRLESGGVF